MKSIKLMSAVMLGILSLGTAVHAQDRDMRDGDRARQAQVERRDVDRRDIDRRDYDRRDHDRRDYDRRDGDRHEYYRYERGHRDGRAMGDRRPEGYGYAREWHRGDRVPPEYRNRQYVVDDWRGHHLHVPPRGYRWVQVGGDYVLVAVATGIIAEMAFAQ